MPDIVSTSGGVNLTANSNTIGGDVTGRDKIVQITNNYYGGAEALSREVQKVASPQPLRVLAVIASPVAGLTDEAAAPGHLSGRAEWARLRDAAKVAPLLLARLRPPTVAELRTALSPNRAGAFNIVHFICHGAPGALALEDDRGLTSVVPAAQIARAVRDGQIDLVVVNACYSAAGQAQSIAQALVDAGVRSVVAHRWPLIDQTAVMFSHVLYRELAAGRALRAAFDEAVQTTTGRFDAERGNAILLGDEALTFRRQDPVQPSHIIENAALPDETARFFGRRAELLKLADIFANEQVRGAALTGIGGIGKSALAFEAADRHAWRFSGGVAYVRASEFGFSLDAALIDLARTLGVSDGGNARRALLDYVNTTPCLLVLDNLERAERDLPQLADLINALNFDAGSKVLLTLRPPLSDRFREIKELNLHAGLDAANALAYVQFIAANEDAPAQWQQPAQAGALVARVSGHPELMRLTVFRSKQTPWARVQQELANLSGRLDEALQDLIGKQVDVAGDLGRTALARLSLFPQPRVLCEAALAACGEAADGLDKLVAAGVIAFESDGVERYALHATAVDYARGKIAARDAGKQDAKQRAIDAYAEWGRAHRSDFDLLQAEHDNLLAALDWAWATKERDESRKAIVNDALGLREFWGVRGYWNERTTWLQRALGLVDETHEADKTILDQHANNLHHVAITSSNQGHLDESIQLFERALTAWKRAENEKGKAATLHQMAGIAVTRGELAGALDLYRQSLDAWERLGDAKGKAATLHEMAGIAVTRGDLAGALDLYRQSLDAWERLGDAKGKAATLHAMANVAVTRGDLAGALDLYRQSLDLTDRLGDAQGKAATLHAMANVAVTRGDLAGALDLYRQSLDAWERLGDAQGKAATLSEMSNVMMQVGDWDKARDLLAESVDLGRKLNDVQGLGYRVAKLGQIAEHDMDLPEAARLYRESVGYFERLGSPVAGQVERMLAAVLQRMAAPSRSA